jgi:nucleoside-diphosphate-sugar epimerase
VDSIIPGSQYCQPSNMRASNMEHRQGQLSPFAAGRITLLDAVGATSLEWTAIFPGVFLDFYALSIPSHVPNNAMALDIVGNAAAIPGTGTYPMYFTHSTDVAKYTVALLGLEKWESKYFIVGDTKTWNEVIAMAEAAKGVKFDVAYDPLDKLSKGEITELPGHRATYEAFGGPAAKPFFQKMISQLAVWMAEGQIKWERPLLNEMFPEIEPLTVEKALPKA